MTKSEILKLQTEYEHLKVELESRNSYIKILEKNAITLRLKNRELRYDIKLLEKEIKTTS